MVQSWRIGIDTGGTFTDGILWNEEDGRIVTAKLLSTPSDPGRAVLAMVDRLFAGAAPGAAQALSYLAHGTTVATNAVLQHQLAPCALITTAGFRDMLEIARQVREDAFDVFFEKPPPLVSRHFCFEVRERMDADGAPVTALDLTSVEDVARRVAATGVRAVAVCLLHAYRNPTHERAVRDVLHRLAPDVAVSLSSDLSSEFREFQRACTTIINAGLMPEVGTYMQRLDEELKAKRLSGSRLVMQSNGGISEFAESAERPVFLIEFGPAAGVVGAAHFAAALGEQDVISFDMGGTTAKVGLVQGGRPHRVQEFEIGVSANRSRGWNAGAAGYPILTSAIDMIEVGTGGGSLAWVDSGGRLRVGPRSAGAAPGPACYGRGGMQPAITDADLVLGRIDPAYFLGGEMQLDFDAAHRTIEALARQVGMEALACAAGIVEIADAAMAQALRVVSVQRGHEPARFKLVPFGGAGPLHAISIAAQVDITSVLVPPRPGVASALGLLVADLKHDYAQTVVQRLDAVNPRQLETVFRGLETKGREPLTREGVAPTAMRFDRTLDLRYVGQSYHLPIVLPPGALTHETLTECSRQFVEAHLAAYGYAEEGEPCELVNVRVAAVGEIGQPTMEESDHLDAEAPRKAIRRVWFADTGFTDCAIYDRSTLRPGMRLRGPAVVEDRDATTLVHPGWDCSVECYAVMAIRKTR